jgi:hypothetical protein
MYLKSSWHQRTSFMYIPKQKHQTSPLCANSCCRAGTWSFFRTWPSCRRTSCPSSATTSRESSPASSEAATRSRRFGSSNPVTGSQNYIGLFCIQTITYLNGKFKFEAPMFNVPRFPDCRTGLGVLVNGWGNYYRYSWFFPAQTCHKSILSA